jgi:hypothetical protein
MTAYDYVLMTTSAILAGLKRARGGGGGQLVGGFVGYVTNPLDIVKTRLMTSTFAAGAYVHSRTLAARARPQTRRGALVARRRAAGRHAAGCGCSAEPSSRQQARRAKHAPLSGAYATDAWLSGA